MKKKEEPLKPDLEKKRRNSRRRALARAPIRLPEDLGGGLHPTLKSAKEGYGIDALEMFGDFARRLGRPLTKDESMVLRLALLHLSKGKSPEIAFMHRHDMSKGVKSGRPKEFDRTYVIFERIDELHQNECGELKMDLVDAKKEVAKTTINPKTGKPYSLDSMDRIYAFWHESIYPEPIKLKKKLTKLKSF